MSERPEILDLYPWQVQPNDMLDESRIVTSVSHDGRDVTITSCDIKYLRTVSKAMPDGSTEYERMSEDSDAQTQQYSVLDIKVDDPPFIRVARGVPKGQRL